jgi:hypothetical protein
MRFLTLLIVFIASVAVAKEGSGRGPHGDTSSGATGGTRAGGGGGSMSRGTMGQRNPPAPLDPARKISEQDCSKPIDPQAGNLRCK